MSLFSKKNSFDSSKCVSLLERTQERIGILKKKRSILVKQSRDDVAKLLQRGQDANAAARVEYVFREENIRSAYELLEQYCQLVRKGTKAIRSDKECSAELKEAIDSLIYAAPRCGELQELQKLRDIFISRYGPQYVSAILDLRPECAVNAQIIQKLSSHPPNSDTKLNLLKAISLEYKIDWNYQSAVAASFKTGESSEKPKVSPSVNQASKQGLADNGPKQSIPVNSKPKEPAANLAAHTVMPTKAGINKSDPSEDVERNRSSSMSGNSADTPKHKGHISTVGYTMVRHISPRQRDIVGANKSSTGSPTTAEESVREDRSKPNVSLPAHDSAASTFQRTEPRKKNFVDKIDASSANREEQNPFTVHLDVSGEDVKDKDLPQVIDYQLKKGVCNPKVNLTASRYKNAYHQAHDHRSSSMAMGRAKASRHIEDDSKVNNSSANGYKNFHHEAHDYRSSAMTMGGERASTFVEADRSSIKAMGREEASTFVEDEDRGQLIGTRCQRELNVDIHERSSDRNRQHRNPLHIQAKYQQEMHSSGYQQEMHSSGQQERLTAVQGPSTRSSKISSKLRSMKMEVDQELDELESVLAEAAHTANIAMDMIHTSSMRSRADDKRF